MSNKLNLEVQTLLDTVFAIDFKGYSAKEVDGFLDLVIEDYQTYQTILVDLNRKINELERTNASLRAKLIEAEGKARVFEDGGNTGNVDIIKRLSRLEQEVFNKK